MDLKNDIYSRIPNDFFYGECIIKNTNKNILMMYDSLYMRRGLDNISSISIEYIIEYCGLKPNRNKGKTNDTIKDLFLYLENTGYINILNKEDLKSIKNLILIHFKKYADKNYVELKRSEIEKISNSESKLDKTNLLIIFLYLKSRMYRRQNGDDLVKSGGIPETCFPTYENIYSDIDISKRSISRYITELDKLDLIRYANSGKWYDPKEISKDGEIAIKDSGNLYTLFTKDEDVYKNNLKEAKKNQRQYYESLGRVFI